MKAIETKYAGCRFRSRLEARWAVFFQTLHLEWHYEPEGFELPSGTRYLPDFFLPTVSLREHSKLGMWLEIKPIQPPQEEYNKISEFGAPHNKGPLLYLVDTHPDDRNVVMLVGSTPSIRSDSALYGHQQMGPWWDSYMAWMRCHWCGRVKIEFTDAGYNECHTCGGPTNEREPSLLEALDRAKSARFEFSR